MDKFDNASLRQVIDAFSGNLMITNPRETDNPCVYVSQAFCEMSGYNHEDLLGKNPRVLQGKNTSEEQRSYIRSLVKIEAAGTATITNYKKNGDEYLVEIHLCPVYDHTGQLTFWAASHRDITNDWQRQQQTLQELLAIKNHS